MGKEIGMVYFYKNWRLRRSVLFIPATNERAINKAATLECDGVIFDLEDSVANELRDVAYTNLAELVANDDLGGREKIVRLTHPDTPTFAADLKAGLSGNPDCILLPKIESAREIVRVADIIGNSIEIWAMIETPKGLANLEEICAISDQTNLTCIVVGPNDLAKTTGARMEPGRAVMLPWLMQVLAMARCYDLCVLDGVFNNFRDLDGFKEECRQGASMGYDGKTLIHPTQIEAANRHFGITDVDYNRAKAIKEAFELPQNSTKAAIQLNGEMVERLHLDMANQLLSAFQGDQS